MDDEQHWFSLVFQYTKHDPTYLGGQVATASLYVGYNSQKITVPRIKQAKVDAGVPPTAVMLSCSYLGHMTRKEMLGE